MAFPLLLGLIVLAVLASDATTLFLNKAPSWVRPLVWAVALILATYLLRSS